MPTTHMVEGGRASAPQTVFIALPTYSGQIGTQTSKSLMPALKRLDDEGIAWVVAIEEGNCHVDDARNSLVRRFMMTDCTDLVFIDSDVGFTAKALVELVRFDRDVVAGVYPKKGFDEGYPVHPLPGEMWSDKDGLVEVAGAPTGFMRIRRNVFDTLIAFHVKRGFIGQGGKAGDPLYYPLFERTIEDGRRWSGDYAFCRKWRAAGGHIYVYPEWTFTHEGNYVWQGCLGDWWRKKANIESPRFTRAIKRLLAGDNDFQTFVELAAGWGNPAAAGADMLEAVYAAALKAEGHAIETGSGLTTIVAGIAARKTGKLHVTALESDLLWHGRIEKVLATIDPPLPVTVVYAPMRRYEGFAWYSLPDTMPAAFSLVICDGPKRDYGRSGLWEYMGDVIAGAMWIVDDLDDPAQLDMVKAYAGGREVHILGQPNGKQFGIVKNG